MKIELCDIEYPKVSIHITAELMDEKLRISGQDIGKACEEVWGDSDYEYFYVFDKVNTDKLFKSLTVDKAEDKLVLLNKHFHGVNCCRDLRDFCQEHNIEYSFFSY